VTAEGKAGGYGPARQHDYRVHHNGAEVLTYPNGGVTPFRGGKRTTWEGGMRAPLVVRWPGHTLNLCASNYRARYRPAARQPQEIDLGAAHLGFRAVLNRSDGGTP
jgi:hypothetical protein